MPGHSLQPVRGQRSSSKGASAAGRPLNSANDTGTGTPHLRRVPLRGRVDALARPRVLEHGRARGPRHEGPLLERVGRIAGHEVCQVASDGRLVRPSPMLRRTRGVALGCRTGGASGGHLPCARNRGIKHDPNPPLPPTRTRDCNVVVLKRSEGIVSGLLHGDAAALDAQRILQRSSSRVIAGGT